MITGMKKLKRSSQAFSLVFHTHYPVNQKRLNTYFDNKHFEDASKYDQKVLTRRLDDWRDVTQRKYIPDLYEGLNTLKTDCEYKGIISDSDSDDEFIENVKNLRIEDLTYPPDDVTVNDIPNFSLSPDHNEKVEERRRQRENEIGSEQDRLLANYLQKLEDNGRTAQRD